MAVDLLFVAGLTAFCVLQRIKWIGLKERLCCREWRDLLGGLVACC